MEPSSPIHKVWKPELYKVQLEAPTPKAVLRKIDIINVPEFLGYEYHGVMGHQSAEKVLCISVEGSYLIRKSPGANDFFTLSVQFNNKTKHFKIFYKDNIGYYLKENFKNYKTIYDLVADGLINFYMQIHAPPIIKEMMLQSKKCYQQSPCMTLNNRKLRALSNDICKSSILSPNQEDTNDLFIVYKKLHTFKIQTLRGLNWCELCANFLWGFTAQGVKCEDCGFIAHIKCSELAPAKCVPDLKRIRGVFGTDLTTLVTAHHCNIPFVIRRCVEEVECRGMLQEGIYRVSGFADEIEALKLALDRDGEKTNISELVYGNINVIAGTLKLYLRLLPIPLITFQAYPAFITSTREQVIALRKAMKILPSAHYNCLKYMIDHLNRVASHFAANKMNEHNLATVFAPTLIAIPQHMTNLSQEIFMLTTLITNCQAVFM